MEVVWLKKSTEDLKEIGRRNERSRRKRTGYPIIIFIKKWFGKPGEIKTTGGNKTSRIKAVKISQPRNQSVNANGSYCTYLQFYMVITALIPRLYEQGSILFIGIIISIS